MAKKKLKNISEIRRFFHRNEIPIYFISATNFNLLGLDEWVRNFKYVNYLDCYDGKGSRPVKSMRLAMSDAGETTELLIPAGVVSAQLRCYCIILEEFRVTGPGRAE